MREDVGLGPAGKIQPSPGWQELESRLRKRGANDDNDIALRLKNAQAEMALSDKYDYLIVNDELDRAAADMACIIRAEHCRPSSKP